MSPDEILARIISIRHHCFVHALDGGSWDAFYTLNRVYVPSRTEMALKGSVKGCRKPVQPRQQAA
jgi:hypothetical protein